VKSVLRIFFHAPGANPWVVLACLVVASICEGVGLASLVPLLAAASGSSKTSFISTSIHGTLASLGLDASLGALIVIMILGLLLKALISMEVMRRVGYANAEVANSMRVRLIRQMLGARWSYLLEHPSGRIANAFSGEVGRSQQAYQLAAQFVAQAGARGACGGVRAESLGLRSAACRWPRHRARRRSAQRAHPVDAAVAGVGRRQLSRPAGADQDARQDDH